MLLIFFYLWDRISALTGVYASTWLVDIPHWATSTLAESVPTPAEFESQSQSDPKSQSELASYTKHPEHPQMTMQSRVAEVKARYAVVAVDGVACTNVRNTRVLVLNDGQCTCACACVVRIDDCGAAPTELRL